MANKVRCYAVVNLLNAHPPFMFEREWDHAVSAHLQMRFQTSEFDVVYKKYSALTRADKNEWKVVEVECYLDHMNYDSDKDYYEDITHLAYDKAIGRLKYFAVEPRPSVIRI